MIRENRKARALRAQTSKATEWVPKEIQWINSETRKASI